jgi:hypothetical protein
VAPGLALDVVESEGRIRFVNVAPAVGPGSIQFIASAEVTPWVGEGTWTNDTTPGTSHPITITNRIGIPQLVEIRSASAFTHQLRVEGGAGMITVAVDEGLSLSATAGVTLVNQGAIKLKDSSLVSSNTNVQAGGQLVGNGNVVGNLMVGVAAGVQPAILSPSRPMDDVEDEIVGHLGIIGNYQQGLGGTLVVNVEGKDAGQFDTINVSGQAALGGELQVVVADGAAIQSGDTIEILTAGSLAPNTVFDRIETTGVGDLYFAINYPNTAQGSGQSHEPGASASGTFLPHGDLNRDTKVNEMDVPLFALGLRNEEAFFSATPLGFCLCIEADEAADMDDNGRLDFDDIDNFAMELEMGGMANARAAVLLALSQVPEPHSLSLGLLGLLPCVGLSLRNRKS